MTVLDRAERFLRRDLWTRDLGAQPWLQRVALRFLRLVVAVAAEFRNRLFDARAAGLLYTTLLSMVPFLAVAFSVLKAFGAHQLAEPVIAEALAPLGEKGEEITAKIIDFVNNLNLGVLGAVGVGLLFFTSYSLISKVEDAFNAIWRIKHSRTWTRKFTDYLSVVLVGPLLIVTAMGLMASAQSHWLVQRALEIEPLGSLWVAVAKLMPLLLLFGGFVFLNKFMPNTQVRFGSAVVGGATTAVLWNLAGAVFASFVATSARYSAIYSTFAILILFLIWLYVCWLVVLIGAQVAYFHQHPTDLQSHMLWGRGSHSSREQVGLGLLLEITRRFLEGKGPVRPRDLAAETEAPTSVVEELVEEFVGSGVLCHVEEPPGVALVRPPEQVPLADVLRLIERRQAPTGATTADEDDPVVANVLRRRDQAVETALEGITLRTLAEAD